MMNTEIVYMPLGIIRTPFTNREGMPIQPEGAGGYEGNVEIKREFVQGLIDLEGFSHLILIYHFHLASETRLMVTPFMDDKPHGVFATRAPLRPNPVGISVVKLKSIVGNRIFFYGADMLDGTPLIDIKPFFEKFDNRTGTSSGWLDKHRDLDIKKIQSDKRFY